MRRLAVLTLFGSLVTAALVTFSPPAGAISDGNAITSAPGWSAYITYDKKTFLGFTYAEKTCSGEVVADDWVLTAAHCAVLENSDGSSTLTPQNPATFRVVLGRSNLNATHSGAQWTVDQVAISPSWDPTTGSGDLALLKLHGALKTTASPLPLAPIAGALPNGASLTAYGYGNIAESYSKKDLAAGNYSKYHGMSPTYLERTKNGSYVFDNQCTAPIGMICLHDVGKSGILHGDSGGPWVSNTNLPSIDAITHGVAYPIKTSATTVSWQYATATDVTTPIAHSWITDTAGIVQPAIGEIVRNSSSGAAFLFESDGLAHAVRTGKTYNCLTGQGHRVANLTPFLLAEIPQGKPAATCDSGLGSKANILLYGDGDSGSDPNGLTNLSSVLTAAGYTVTVLNQTALPSDLSLYGQIWHYGIDSPDATDSQTLETFVQGGGSVYLTGEWGDQSNFNNTADLAILNAVLPTPVGVSGEDDSSGPLQANPSVIDGVASTPNVLTTWKPTAVGALTGVDPSNVLFTDSFGNASGAVWDVGSSGGRLAILMDVNWAQPTYQDSATMPLVTQNLARFLSLGLA